MIDVKKNYFNDANYGISEIFGDYDMKNHDIHENKNVCPEFNGEKMHEQNKAFKWLGSFFQATFRYTMKYHPLYEEYLLSDGKKRRKYTVECFCVAS